MYIASVSVESPGPPPVIAYGMSNVWMAVIVRKISATKIAGRSIGSVISTELLPRRRAVDLGGFVERARDRLQPGEQHQRHERRRLPDDRDADGGDSEREARSASPAARCRSATSTSLTTPVLVLEEPAEDEARRTPAAAPRAASRPRRTGHLTPERHVGEQRQPQPDDERAGHRDDDVQDRVPRRAPRSGRRRSRARSSRSPRTARRATGCVSRILKKLSQNEVGDRIDDDHARAAARPARAAA